MEPSPPETRDVRPTPGQPGRRRIVLRVARICLALAAIGFLTYALVTQWSQVRASLQALSVGAISVSLAVVLAALLASMMAWRAILADLGSPLSVPQSAGVLFPGQLAKYVPGSLWSIIAATELATRLGVPRGRSAVAGLLFNILLPGVALVLALMAVPALLGAGGGWFLWLLMPAALAVVVALRPPVMNGGVRLLLRLIRRNPRGYEMSAPGLRRALWWSVLSALLLGAHMWVLVVDLGASPGPALTPAVGGFLAAWVLGFVVVIAPAGLGVREYVLVLALAPQLGDSAASALTLAVVSRLLLTVADIAMAAVAAATVAARRAGR